MNNLYTEPVLEELSSLNVFEKQFIQCAKCFQIVVRLGTYTQKVPIYNSVKAVKGTMFLKTRTSGRRPRMPGFLKLFWFARRYVCVCLCTHPRGH